ncbi:transposase family protein [Hymenobacter coccineus]|uniref:transposase family protein n=1 Tax=Hymenobacter coccineus TaxID=1908235 RepID=UPI0009F52BCC
MLSQPVTSFATLPDPRCAGRTRHRLLNLLVIAVCAVVAGAETWVDRTSPTTGGWSTLGWPLSWIYPTVVPPTTRSGACSR